jgi:hypothetical protein
MAGTVRIAWDEGKIRWISEELPVRAHLAATALAAEAAAAAIKPKHSSTGRLAADVRRPKPVGYLTALIGSDLVYARIQNEGGTIVPRTAKRLLIHGQDLGGGEVDYGRRIAAGTPGGTGGQYASLDVTASASSVTLEAKHYLDAAIPVYEDMVTALLIQDFPS